MSIAVAAPNDLAAQAGREVAGAGGNAIDAAIAAALVAMTTEPGICSLPGGAYLTIQPADGPPVTIDANATMPGHGLPPERFGQGCFEIFTEYGGGVTMTIGHGTVATPGTPAGLALAHERYGAASWADVFAPAIEAAAKGFPMGSASAYYLDYVHQDLYGWHAPSHAAIHDAAGVLIPQGGLVVVDGLADSLRQIATEGVDAFYRGDLGARIVADIEANDGILTREDLERFTPIVREPVLVEASGWRVATNPPPAVGGVTLGAMLTLLADHLPPDLGALVRAQDLVLSERLKTLDLATDREAAGQAVLTSARTGELRAALQSPSTIHVSAVDGVGNACAITASAGYGSGAMPPGTGLWLNNCLGEQELNRHGLHSWDVGTILPSNMAPTVARHPDGTTLAIGSPGADRITTAILQTLMRVLPDPESLTEAIAAPRVHVRHDADGEVLEVGYEADLDRSSATAMDLPWREFHPLAMFFGGVAAALRHPDGRLEAAADPRRGGGTHVG